MDMMKVYADEIQQCAEIDNTDTGITQFQLEEVEEIVKERVVDEWSRHIIMATLRQLYSVKESLWIKMRAFALQNMGLKRENAKLRCQNEKYKSVLTSELHAVYEVRQSKWRKRRDLDPVMAVHCTKHEAMTLCQYWNQANNKDGIFFYIAKEGDI